MKVYVIICYHFLGELIHGIYADKEKAEKELIKCNLRVKYEVEEFDCDETFYVIKEYDVIN